MPKTGTKSSVHCSFRYIVLKPSFVPKRRGDKISILPIHRAFRGDKIGDKILTGICTLFFPIHRTKAHICSENAQNPAFLSPLFFPIDRAFKGDKKGDKMGTNRLIFVPFCPRGVKNRPFLPIHRKGDKIEKYIACNGFRDLTTVFLYYIIIYFTKK